MPSPPKFKMPTKTAPSVPVVSKEVTITNETKEKAAQTPRRVTQTPMAIRPVPHFVEPPSTIRRTTRSTRKSTVSQVPSFQTPIRLDDALLPSAQATPLTRRAIQKKPVPEKVVKEDTLKRL